MFNKPNFNLIFKCLLSLQLVWAQVAAAATVNNDLSVNMNMMASLPTLQAALDLVSLEAGKADVMEVETQLKKSGVNLNQQMPLTYKNGSLYLGKDEIKVTPNGINYKGINFKYNASRAYSQNYEAFVNRLNGKDTYSKSSLFMNTANAAMNKGDIAPATAIAGTLIAAFGMILSSPAVAAAGVVVGIAAIVHNLIGSAEKPAQSDVKEFKCLPNGWTLKTKQGAIVKATEDKLGAMQVEVTKKDGEKSVAPLAEAQRDAFTYTKVICSDGESKQAEKISQLFLPKAAKSQSAQKSQSIDGFK